MFLSFLLCLDYSSLTGFDQLLPQLLHATYPLYVYTYDSKKYSAFF